MKKINLFFILTLIFAACNNDEDKHYQNQIDQLGSEEKALKRKIIKFRQDELHHKDIAYEKGATKKGIYSIMDKIIKTGSKIAIKISEKY